MEFQFNKDKAMGLCVTIGGSILGWSLIGLAIYLAVTQLT
jgi:hypothetical protein